MTATPFQCLPRHTIEFTGTELLNAALALKSSGAEAYVDERLTLAAAHYHLAAKLFFEAGYKTLCNRCSILSVSIGQEADAIAAGLEEDASYLAEQILELQKGA